jgi:glycosyltransferase involved in cell wall biosynthesis
MAGRRSLKSLYDCPGAFVARARALAAEPFDLVIIEYWQLYPLLDVLAGHTTVLLTHDVDQQVNRDREVLEPNPVRRWFAARRHAVERREETGAYAIAQRVWTLTTRDADAVRAIAGARNVAVLPFGVAADAFVAEAGARTSHEVLFMGAMGALFNRDALIHFARDIHPVLADLPGIRFTIIGGALPAAAATLAENAAVTVVGHAPDPGVYLRRAACLVVPLRYGGGLRIRIIEAMAAGLPVVCSPVAVAGMELRAGSEVLVATPPAEYRAWVERLLQDPGFAASVARAAREAAWSRFGPEARGAGMRACAQAAIAAGPV